MTASYLRSGNGNQREWRLLTPVEWVKGGFEIRLAEGAPRLKDSEIDELIEEFSESHGGVEEFPKTGYRSLALDLEARVATLRVSNDEWKSYMGTNENPRFFEVMVKRFNKACGTNLSWGEAMGSLGFFDFANKYSANALAQCHSVLTPSGVVVGERSGRVEVERETWHVVGGYFQAVGADIYKKGVPKHNGIPVTNLKKFGTAPESVSEEHLKANAICNIYDESNGTLVPSPDDISYVGIVHELTNNNVELIGIVRTGVSAIGKDWEHGRILHIPLDRIPQFASGQAMVPAGQAALVCAYLREKGLERISDFPFVRR